VSSAPQAAGQDRPEMLQRMAGFGWPLLAIAARNGCVAPSSTPMEVGVSAMVMSLRTVMLAEACFVGSATLCAVTVTVARVGRFCGAV
jgi:hypothetical protein